MLIETLGTARDLGRLQEIAGVLVRHGLGDVVRFSHEFEECQGVAGENRVPLAEVYEAERSAYRGRHK